MKRPRLPFPSIEEAEPSVFRSRDRILKEEDEDEEAEDQGSLEEFVYEEDEYGIPCESGNHNEVEEEGSLSFSESFYASGVDYSSLCHLGKTNGNLVQASLSAMWGLKSKGKTNGKLVQASLSAMWGLKSKDEPKPEMEGLRVDGMTKGTRQQFKACPFYKKIPGTSFTVDAFRYGSVDGCTTYFLTHFHSDHYIGLSKGWSHGPIYCTPTTARLLTLCLCVEGKYICPLEIDTVHVIDGTKVLMLEANHCPGAALIYFELRDGRRFLHTGDFRACQEMYNYPVIKDAHINTLYLDTTYCNPKYRFPSQKDVIDYAIKVTKNTLSKEPKTLVVVGAYSIGKERVFLSIAQALGVQIYVDSRRGRILTCLSWPELSERLCSDARCTFLHVLPMSSLHPEKLKQYAQSFQAQFTSVLAFRPTGWTYSNKIGNMLDSIKPVTKSNVTIYGVPYSEHSSFLELKEFVQFLQPKKIIATVNVGSPTQRDTMQSYFRQWLSK